MNVYEIITEQIVKKLESGVIPWRRPWSAEMPCNLVSGKEYRGINPFMLGTQGYGSKFWVTFNQVKTLGGHVKKGEKSSTVIFWKIGDKKLVQKPDGTSREEKSFLLRYYSVFNIAQTEGIEAPDTKPAMPSIETCEAILAGMPNAPRREQSEKGWYKPSKDTVGMPAKELFQTPEGYYSTLFHELTHSTGHASRIGREGIENLNEFGSESYSKEELVAEMGSAMLCGVAGIAPATLENSAAYLQNWLERLKADSRLLVSAASQAQKACDYIRGTVAKSETETESEEA